MSLFRKNKSKGISISHTKQYKCLVPECDTTHRYDNLKRHYRQNVDEESFLNGNVDNLGKIKKEHTQYFISRGIKYLKDIPDKSHHTYILGNNEIDKYFTLATPQIHTKRLNVPDSDEKHIHSDLQKVMKT